MTTEFTITEDDQVLTVRAANSADDYLYWRVTKSNPTVVYFESHEEHDRGPDIIREVTIDDDGTHIVLNGGKLIHFYFSMNAWEKIQEFKGALARIYSSNKKVLETID